MHAEPTHCSCPVPVIETERTVMMVLLSGDHEPYTRADLQREVAGAKDDPLAVIDALNSLYSAGLVHFNYTAKHIEMRFALPTAGIGGGSHVARIRECGL